MTSGDRFGLALGRRPVGNRAWLRRRTVGAPWLMVALGACVMVGGLAGMKPSYGIAAALGLIFTAAVVNDVTLGFVVFTVFSFLDVLNENSSFGGSKAFGLILFVSWMARIGQRKGFDLGRFVTRNPALTYSLVAMLGWSALSATWASSPGTALSGASRYALDMMLVPIAFGAVREREHVVWVVIAFIIGAAVSVLYGFVQPVAATSAAAGRFVGANGDANGEATVLAASIPLVLSLAPSLGRSPRLRAAGLFALLLMFVGLVETLSREGLLSLAGVMIAAVVFGGRWRGKAAVLLVVGIVGVAGYYLVIAPASSLQRVTMSDTSGRSDLWTVAGRVIAAHPLLGVGQDNFQLVERQYINQPGAIHALYIITTPKLTHNTFLEAAADVGIPGLITLIAVLFFCLRAIIVAAHTFERIGDEQMELISRGILFSLVAVLVSDFFVAAGYAKYLWIPLALCPVMLGIARRELGRFERHQGPAPARI